MSRKAYFSQRPDFMYGNPSDVTRNYHMVGYGPKLWQVPGVGNYGPIQSNYSAHTGIYYIPWNPVYPYPMDPSACCSSRVEDSCLNKCN
jgi:hypothetical protein